MSLTSRLHYYRRITSAYLLPGKSQLTFWHDRPTLNPAASAETLGEYYMLFIEKAGYAGACDSAGVPMLDYHGNIGVQYNPIAIAQWGLGNHDLYCRTGREAQKQKLVAAAEWLCTHLERNSGGLWVWNHLFDWEYRTTLRAPWYSGLAQGQGISFLVRAHRNTGNDAYLEAAARAFASFEKPVEQGGVAWRDNAGDFWIEEYIVSPPTHILNGFIWAAWGLYDYFLATGNKSAESLFSQAIETLRKNLARYDNGFWSLYEQSGTFLPMLASPFYHQLHIVQLRVLHRLTGDQAFAECAERWAAYARSAINRTRALCYKGLFKLCYY